MIYWDSLDRRDRIRDDISNRDRGPIVSLSNQRVSRFIQITRCFTKDCGGTLWSVSSYCELIVSSRGGGYRFGSTSSLCDSPRDSCPASNRRKDVAVAFSIRFLINDREDISLLECHVHVIYGSSKRIIDRTKLGNSRRWNNPINYLKWYFTMSVGILFRNKVCASSPTHSSAHLFQFIPTIWQSSNRIPGQRQTLKSRNGIRRRLSLRQLSASGFSTP